ncbi:hypothetical protein CMUS01_03307 [Colletotrichum musicola]|uniref:NADAR domain-containing protein n=1 Tax=Colletotrichum musicola TaxID=2175873 RepID=A0A8H6NTF0_9PEZI|nr:hypothetical protein CMUS01_03307 [Colletotrichum musicola]
MSTPIYFWRETGPEGYLSQWWTSHPFTSHASSPSSPPMTFKTAEHYMMHAKALLFSDPEVALDILKASHPRQVKSLGRRVRNFEEEQWNEERERIVREGNLLKFRASDELRQKLLDTGERELVEASPMDRIWGIGFSPERAPGSDRRRWGLNLLGKVLMEVRAVLREEEEEEREKADDDEEKKSRKEKRRQEKEEGRGEEASSSRDVEEGKGES